MIRLIIDNHTASLSSDEKLKIQHENPFTTENGEYTYEITLPMDSVNQKIFGHINRHDVAQKKITFPAMLYSGMTLLLSGTAIVTSVSDEDVGVQLVGQNSSTNFLYDDVYIDEMNLEEFFVTTDFSDLLRIPVVNETDGKIMNEHHYFTQNDGQTFLLQMGRAPMLPGSGVDYRSPTAYSFRLSKLLSAIIQRLGLFVNTNELEGTFFNDIVCINSTFNYSSRFISTVIPHWSVREFFQNLGQFMGVAFVFDMNGQKVDIVSSKNYTNNNAIHISEVVDEFECSVDNDETESQSVDIYGYDLDNEQQKQYEQVDQSIYNLHKYLGAPDINTAYQIIDAKGDDKYTYIIGVGETIYAAQENSAAPYGFYLRPIDNLRASGQLQQEPNVSLKFVPVHYTIAPINVFKIEDGKATLLGADQGVIYPMVEGIELNEALSLKRNDAEEDANIMEFIESSSSTDQFKPDKFHVAIYDDYALQSIEFEIGEGATKTVFDFPLPYVINDSAYFWFLRAQGQFYANPNRTKSLSLQKIAGQQTIGQYISERTIQYDKSVTYKKQFIFRNGIPDVRAKFVIRGKTYICNKLTFEVDNNGIIPLMEGEFFLIN